MIQVSMYGRLGRDPEQRTTASGTAMATSSMAVDVTKKGGDQDSEWFKLIAFGRQAEALLRHHKGDLLGVMGTLTRERWTGNDGQERTAWSVVVDALMSAQTVRPGGGRKRSGSDQAGSASNYDEGAQAPLNDEIPF